MLGPATRWRRSWANADDFADLRQRPLPASTAKPNFEGDRYVLLLPKVIDDPALEARLLPLRAKLLAAREKRPAPLLDDKVLTSWNALMIAAYAEGGRVLKDDRYKARRRQGGRRSARDR